MNLRLPNRQPGYQKGRETSSVPTIPKDKPDKFGKPKKSPEPETSEPAEDSKSRSARIWAYLQENKNVIKVKGLTARIGYDNANFCRLQKSEREIPEKYLALLEKALESLRF